MNPLALVKEAVSRGSLPTSLASRLERRLTLVEEGASRVERASGLRYPPYFVEPRLRILEGAGGEMGVVYARTLPIEVPERVDILVELSSPLVLYASRGTLHAVVAHEFLHYADLVRRFVKMEIASDTADFHLFEASYSDLGRALDPKLFFSDRGLLRLLSSHFRPSLADEKLDARTLKDWLNRGMPVARLAPEANVVRVSVASILKTRFDQALVRRLGNIGG